MSLFPQFDCFTRNKTARRAMEQYAGFLKKAFEQYRSLWEDYVELQEKYERCNTRPPFGATIDEPCAKTKDELTPQRELRTRTAAQKSDSPPLLELTTTPDWPIAKLAERYINDYQVSDFDVNVDLENLSRSQRKGDDSPPRSPVFLRTCQGTGIASMTKKLIESPEVTSVCSDSDSNTIRQGKASPKGSKKLEISTTHHVETTLLPSGKRLKQSRLVLRPIKDNKKKASIPATRKMEQASRDDVLVMASTIAKDNVTKADETFSEDVIEISPTQNKFKFERYLKLKRKILSNETVKNFPNKNIHHHERKAIVETDDVNFELYHLPKYTSTQVKSENYRDNSDKALKDKINIHNYTPGKYDMANIEIAILKAEKKIQLVNNQARSVAPSMSNLDKDETFYLPAEQAAKRLDDLENKRPATRLSLDTFDSSPPKRTEDIPEQLNTRRKIDRVKLIGRDCWECEEYYKSLRLTKEELQKRKDQCSRHRFKYEKPRSPEGFWDPEFPDTMSSPFQQNIN